MLPIVSFPFCIVTFSFPPCPLYIRLLIYISGNFTADHENGVYFSINESKYAIRYKGSRWRQRWEMGLSSEGLKSSFAASTDIAFVGNESSYNGYRNIVLPMNRELELDDRYRCSPISFKRRARPSAESSTWIIDHRLRSLNEPERMRQYTKRIDHCRNNPAG